MSKTTWEGTTLLAPLPVVLATVGTMEKTNIITIAWTGIVNSQKPMTYISVRKERYSHALLMENKEFVINLVSEDLCRRTDTIGVKSGKEIDKFETFNLTKKESTKVLTPMIEESPISLECKVTQVLDLGSHDMFLAEIVAVNLDEELLDDKGKLHINRANLVTYAHGEYYALGKKLGKFGFSVKKTGNKKKFKK